MAPTVGPISARGITRTDDQGVAPPNEREVASRSDDTNSPPVVDSCRRFYPPRKASAMRNHTERHSRSHTEGRGARQDRTRLAGRVATVIALSGLVVGAPAGSAVADPPERDHTVTTSPAEGRFQCGELLLSVTAGTETEIFDGSFKSGVVHVWIQRRYEGVTMAGSDGLVYRATAHVNSHFVLVAPDFDNPVRGDEIIHVSFLGGPQGSPGYLNEHLRIRDGVETDEVTGSCNYAN